MKKIFVDIYLMFNLGDDLFLDILAKKYPNCQFTVNYLGRNYDKLLSQYGNVTRRQYTLLNKIGQKLGITDTINNYDKIAEEHDALLFIGGSIFREEDYHMELYNDRTRLVKKFKERGKPTFVLGANFGPYQTVSFYEDYLSFFKMCDDVCFRDKYSYDLYNSLEQVRYAPDIVFQLNTTPLNDILKKNRIGFSIIDVKHKKGLSYYEDEYISSTVKAIRLLVDKGYECYLLSFCVGEGDLDIINKIKAKLSREEINKVYTYTYTGNLEEAIKLIGTFQLFFAARFHANILGLLLEVGLLPVIYSNKTTEMLKDIDFRGELIEMKNLSLQYDENAIYRALEENRINLGKVSKDSEKQFLMLSNFIFEKDMEKV